VETWTQNHELPEMCDEAQKCTEYWEKWLLTEVTKNWNILFQNMIASIDTTMTTMKSDMQRAWGEMEQCPT
jgi:hypothetical protein